MIEQAASGSFTFDSFKVVEKPSMMDFLRTGWQISTQVCIDFTASNGQPN
jgi:hypothetical protein